MIDTNKIAVCGSLCLTGGFGVLAGGLFGIFGKSKVVKEAEKMENNCKNYSNIINQYTQDDQNYILEIDNLIMEMQELQENYQNEVKKITQEMYTIVEDTEEEGATEQDETSIDELKNNLRTLGEQSNQSISALGLQINDKIDTTRASQDKFEEATEYANKVEEFGNRCSGKKRKIYKRAAKIALPASASLKNDLKIFSITSDSLVNRKVNQTQIKTEVENIPNVNAKESSDNQEEAKKKVDEN